MTDFREELARRVNEMIFDPSTVDSAYQTSVCVGQEIETTAEWVERLDGGLELLPGPARADRFGDVRYEEYLPLGQVYIYDPGFQWYLPSECKTLLVGTMRTAPLPNRRELRVRNLRRAPKCVARRLRTWRRENLLAARLRDMGFRT